MSIEQSLHEYKQGLGTFTQHILIALGISVAKQDKYCTIYHTKGCIDEGATEEEIFEACAVAAALAGGETMSQAVMLVRQCVDEFTRVH